MLAVSFIVVDSDFLKLCGLNSVSLYFNLMNSDHLKTQTRTVFIWKMFIEILYCVSLFLELQDLTSNKQRDFE